MTWPRSVRTVFFWTHLSVALTAGVVIFLMSLTGVLLAYEKQITARMDGYHVAPPTPGAVPLSLEALVTRVRAARPATTVGMVTMTAAGDAPAQIRADSGKTLLVDPYTGAVFGEGSKPTRDFFRWLMAWHRWVGQTGEHRAAGKMATGVANLVFLFLVLSGVYLWLPRRWSWKVVKPLLLFNTKARGKARDFNWHHVIGVWIAPALFLVVLSGVFMSYRWPMQWLDRLSGARRNGPSNNTPTGGAGGEGRAMRFGLPMPLPVGRLDTLWAAAQRASGGWASVSVRLPAVGDKTIAFAVDQGGNGRPDQRVRVETNLTSGAVTKVTTYASTPYFSRRLQSWVRGVHTGTVLGVTGQTIAMLASLAGLFLGYTGFALSWRRFRAWRARVARPGLADVTVSAIDADVPVVAQTISVS